MKALLQQLQTGLYFKDPVTWTANLDEAYDFKSSVTARSYSVERGISNAQIVLKFDRAEYDIILPTHYPRPSDNPVGPFPGSPPP